MLAGGLVVAERVVMVADAERVHCKPSLIYKFPQKL
jgi:hypothetical protein